MAIRVKHGLAPAAALAGYGEGKARRDMGSARFVKTPNRGRISGSRSTGVRAPKAAQVQAPIERKPLPIQAPQIIGMRQPTVSTVAIGNAQDAAMAGLGGRFNQQNEAVNAQAWERYRSEMMQSGAGDPGAMPIAGYAPNVGGEVQQPNVSKEYTPKQTEAFNGMSDAYAEAVASGDYTPEELTDIKRQIDAKRMGIEPVERMKAPSRYPEGEDVGQVWNQGGVMLSRNAKGDVVKVADEPKQDAKSTGESELKSSDILKMQDAARNTIADEYDGKASAVPQYKVDEMVQKQIEGIRRMTGGTEDAESGTVAVDSVANVRQTVEKLLGRGMGMITSSKGGAAYDVGGTQFGMDNRGTKGEVASAAPAPQKNSVEKQVEDLWKE